MNYNFIQQTIKQTICFVTLNRPEKHNALNIDLVHELNHCLNELVSDDSVHAVFIFGNINAFSAGGDLKEMKDLELSEAEKRSKFVQSTFKLLHEIKVPVLAFVQGVCYGGGLELAMHADYRICSETARLALPEVKYGMMPGAGGTVLLPLHIGLGEAGYYLFTGNEIELDKALSCGLVQQIINNSEFDNFINEQVQYFTNASRKALIAIKEQMNLNRPDLNNAYKNEAKQFAKLLCEQGHSGIETKFIKKQ